MKYWFATACAGCSNFQRYSDSPATVAEGLKKVVSDVGQVKESVKELEEGVYNLSKFTLGFAEETTKNLQALKERQDNNRHDLAQEECDRQPTYRGPKPPQFPRVPQKRIETEQEQQADGPADQVALDLPPNPTKKRLITQLITVLKDEPGPEIQRQPCRPSNRTARRRCLLSLLNTISCCAQ